MACASIELHIATEGDCTCGTPYPADKPPPTHGHHVESKWGRINHPDPRPDRNEVGHLILGLPMRVKAAMNGEYRFRQRDTAGRRLWQEYRTTTQGERTFLHTAWPIYDHGDGIPAGDRGELRPTPIQRWTWELFPAHFADSPDVPWLIGRWPD